MKAVIRDIDPAEARDLLERVPRACLAFATEQGPQAQPAALVVRDSLYYAGISENAGARPDPGQEVVLLVDEGVHYFDLRAIYIRGHAQPAETPMGAPARRAWFVVVPLKTVAWDYGRMREAADASG